jgi:excisionase family DNA binding protein
VSTPEAPSARAKEAGRCKDQSASEKQTRRQPLSVAEAANYMNVTERYVRRLIAERRVPFLKIGRHVRLRPEDLDAYLDGCRVEPMRAHPFAR